MFKKLKFAIGAFIVGQISVMMYKDKSLKEKIEKAQGFDKVKIIFGGLVDLNKSLFTDLKNYDYEKKINELKEYIEKEKIIIEEKIEDLKGKLSKLNKEKLKPIIDELEEKTNELKLKLESTVNEISKKYELNKKSLLIKDELEKAINIIKEKIEKIKKNV